MKVLSLRISRRTLLRLVLMTIVPGLALIGAGYFYITGGRHISTEDAYLKADKIMVAPEVSGRVIAVAVQENNAVQRGSLLFRVDDEPYRIALSQAQANLALVGNEIEALHAEYRQKKAELAQAEEAIAFAEREFERRQKLSHDRAISPSMIDEARHNLKDARLHATVVQQDLEQVQARLGSDPDQPIQQHPRVQQAQALVDKAALDLRNTRVYAPDTGIVGRLGVHPGDYVQQGTPALSIVETRYYIEANLKETELAHVRVGQPVMVRVDAYPDWTWQGTVESLSPATGAEFSMLPPQNATGNWVKVVQRVPVRVDIETSDDKPSLRAGMSVTVEIDTGYRRRLPGFIRTALAWTGRDA